MGRERVEATELLAEASYAAEMAQFVQSLRYEELPRAVVESAKLHLLDTLGICLAASRLEAGQIVTQVVGAWEGKPESTVIGARDKVFAAAAALANGTLAHSLDYDDTHTASIVHPSAAVVPAALAVGEALGSDGRAVLTAAVAGYEVAIRIGLAAPGQFHDRGYHATPICGTFGAALVAGKLLGLDAARLAHALGLCGSQAAGIQEFLVDGSWAKRLHPGWAAFGGIISAQLAQRGFRGPQRVFEGRFGLYATHLGPGRFDPQKLTAGLGRVWETTQIALKPYPCCHLLHGAIDAALHLKRQHALNPADIAAVECRLPERTIHIVCEPEVVKRRPPTPYAAMFSATYAVAVALLAERAGLDEFSEEKIRQPEVLELAAKVSYAVDAEAEFPKYFPGWVRIRMKDGRLYEHKERINRGHPENPLSAEEVRAKFRENACQALPAGQVEAIIDRVASLERLDNVAELLALCQPR